MRRLVAFILMAVALASATPSAQEQERLFKAAMNTELVDGDLRAAIEQYRRVAGGGNRALAAQALVRMAECYLKLGDAQAQALYRRIARDFGDQADAVALARSRLAEAGSSVSAGRGDRAVWTGLEADGFGTVSPDGRYLTYVDWPSTGNLMVRDLKAGVSRPLTGNTTTWGEFGDASYSAISRDGRYVAYEWHPRDTNRDELRVIDLTVGASSTRLVRGDERRKFRPVDWSPDGRWLSVVITEGTQNQIGVIGTADGELRILKSIEWRWPKKVLFSPDGRHLAFDLPIGDPPEPNHIFVMATDGSSETPVVSEPGNNVLMAWALGGQLLFASDRSGRLALWSVVIAQGRPQAKATLVKDNIGSVWSLGLASSGTLYVWQRAGAVMVKVAALDMPSGSLVDTPGETFEHFIDSRGRPDWSADGKRLLFVSCGSAGGGPCTIFVRDVGTGRVRDVPAGLGYVQFPRLSPDGSRIATNGRDSRGRAGVQVIDVDSGRRTRLEAVAGTVIDWSSDGRSLYLLRTNDVHHTVVQHEPETGTEREVFRVPKAGIANNLKISPDGSMVGMLGVESGHNARLDVASVAGGQPRTLFRAAGAEALHFQWEWTADGKAILVKKGPMPAAADELWFVPLEGTPRKLAIDLRQWVEGGHVQLHPDGRHLAFVANAGQPGAEIWALENFLPAFGVIGQAQATK